MGTKYSRGSEWRKWDLHIHTPKSIENNYGGDSDVIWDKYIDALERLPKEVSVIGITDYYFIDGYEKVMSYKQNGRLKNIDKIFPILEFRIDTFGSGNENKLQKINLHILFDLNESDIRNEIEKVKNRFIGLIPITRLDKHKTIMLSRENLAEEGEDLQTGFSDLIPPTDKVLELINSPEWRDKTFLFLGYKEWSNLEKNKQLKPLKEDLYGRVGAFFSSNYQTINNSQKWLNEFGEKKLLHSLDIHDFSVLDTAEKNEKGEYIDSKKYCCYTWIKADPTFEGLKQILNEPDRVLIQEKPELLHRIETNLLKFIKNILIEKNPSTAIIDEVWYNNISIDVNPGLVAIIGNKGSGKSAITDIIGLCANSHNDNWSFLTKSKFRMPKPYNRSSYFQAKISWYDDSESTKKLDDGIDKNMPERVKYIPQNFLENLCTTEDEKEFEKEMKSIIFQYLPDDQKFGKQSIDEIVEYLSVEINKSEAEIKQKIIQQNELIINLEEKRNPDYEAKLQNALDLKKNELANLEKVKPVKVEKPDHSDNEAERLKQEEITNIQNQIKDLEKQIEEAKVKLSDFSKQIQDLTTLKDALDRLKLSFDNSIKEYNDVFERNGLIANDIIKIEYNKHIIEQKISSLRSTKESIAEQLNPEFSEGLLAKKMGIEKTLKEKEDKLSEPERLYQKYLQDLKIWEDKVNSIKGSDDAIDTILYYKKELKYVREKLGAIIETEESKRNDLISELIENKRKLLDTYTSLYKPISQFIDSYKEDLKSYPMALDAAFIFDNNMDELFFSIVNQQVSGSFNGKEQGSIRLKELCDSIELNDNQLILDFTHKLNQMLAEDHREGFNNDKRNIETQLKKGHTKLELYNFIYCLDYIKPLFQLKLSDKILSALSPGERGALLLLFYLFIDMDDKPLIIDQPEENLDNESVYDYLVTFIKKAKTKRQIIIVTHNPNLAVVCDADQIIKMDIDKKNKNTVSFVSGAIENPQINKSIIDILEGTYPAFHNRGSKYFKTN